MRGTPVVDWNGVGDTRAALTPERDNDLRLMARSLAGLYVAGATLTLLTLVFPHADGGEQLGSLVVIGTAYIAAAVLVSTVGRLPAWALEALLAIGTVHITAVSYFSNERPSPLI